MHNDHLFVSFSKDAASAPIGYPPFHDEIETYAKSLDRAGLQRFFERRYQWHWYPVVTSGLSSFPVHGDLLEVLSQEQVLECIGYAAELCATEDGKRFISALGLLTMLCRFCESPRNVPALTESFVQIRQRVAANAIDPNIGYWFSNAAVFQLATGVVPNGYTGSFDRAGLNAPS